MLIVTSTRLSYKYYIKSFCTIVFLNVPIFLPVKHDSVNAHNPIIIGGAVYK